MSKVAGLLWARAGSCCCPHLSLGEPGAQARHELTGSDGAMGEPCVLEALCQMQFLHKQNNTLNMFVFIFLDKISLKLQNDVPCNQLAYQR